MLGWSLGKKHKSCRPCHIGCRAVICRGSAGVVVEGITALTWIGTTDCKSMLTASLLRTTYYIHFLLLFQLEDVKPTPRLTQAIFPTRTAQSTTPSMLILELENG